MILFQVLAASAAIIHLSSAQIFPFSNLRAFFDPKSIQGRDTDQTSGPATTDVSRPYRQADHDQLPPLDDFSSPDIYSINRDIGTSYVPYTPSNKYTPSNTYTPNKIYTPSITYATATETTKTTTKRRNSSRYRARPERPDIEVIKSGEEDIGVSSVFITPRPNTDQQHFGSEQSKDYSKSRTRTKQVSIQDYHPVQPIKYEDEVDVNPEFSENHSIRQSLEVNLPSEDLNSVNNGLPLEDSIEQTQSVENGGLVDYLVPPNLPSVYEKARKRPKLRSPVSSAISKQKPPTRSSSSKKNSRFRVKKHRGEIKSIGAPLADRATTAKRHISRRRPSYRRAPPLRKPSSEKIPPRQTDLQKQASEMDEQITSETGFSESAGHPRSPHGGERVEFQMHGQKGPHSYKFGYDTGKGHNRQFRFEEKDNRGHVKGHYGFYDKDGKLQMVNYEADPHHGFTAESL